MKWLNIFSEIEIEKSDIPGVPTTATGDSATVSTILGYVFVLGAGIAMIVMILAGIQYIVSQGEPAKTTKARNAIIYAGVGLALCALSFSIVKFVLVRFIPV